MDWEDLKYFIELARCGTLSGAARSLKVNHATVARRLARLETRLAVILFDRRAEGYVLTAKGEAVLADALAMKETAETIQRQRDGTVTLSGLVRLTATRTLADLWLVRQLDGLHRRYPALDLEIIAESRNMSLARREVDLAVRLARPSDGDIIARRIGNLGYGLYATAEQRDRLLRGDDAPFVGFDDESTPEAAWLQHYAYGRRFAFRSNSPLSQTMAAQAGFGIAALPCFLASGATGLVPVFLLGTGGQGRGSGRQIVGARHDDGEIVGESGQTVAMQGFRGNDAAERIGQVACRGGSGDDGVAVSQVGRSPRGRIDAHMGHEPGEDQFAAASRRDPLVQVGPGEGIRPVFDDHVFSVQRGQFRHDGNIPAVRIEHGPARSAVMNDVKDRRTGAPSHVQQGPGCAMASPIPASGSRPSTYSSRQSIRTRAALSRLPGCSGAPAC